MDDRNLIAVAEQAAATSRVVRGALEGATIKGDDGRTFLGCRLEFEDPSLDQDAISNGIAAGRVEGMRKVVRAGYYSPARPEDLGEDGLPVLSKSALMRLREVATADMVVILSPGTGQFIERPLKELLAQANMA